MPHYGRPNFRSTNYSSVYAQELSRAEQKLSGSSVLIGPIRFLKTIKNQHNLSYYGISVFFVHICLLIHATIKSLVYLFLMQYDNGRYRVPRDLLDYLESIYYSYWIADLNIDIINYLAPGLCIFSVAIRLVFIAKFIRGPVDNRNSRKRIRPSQLTLAYMTIFKMSIMDYIRLTWDSMKHRVNIRIDHEKNSKHCSFSAPSWLHLDHTTRTEKIYFHNLIDSNNCLKEYEECFTSKLGDNYRSQSNWYLPTPMHRCDLSEMSYITGAALAGGVVAFFFYFMFVFVITYLTLATFQARHFGLNDYSELSGQLDWEFLLHHWLVPKNVVKIFEAYIFVCVLIPPIFDAALLYFTIVLLYSRVLKMRDILQHELQSMRTKNLSRIQVSRGEYSTPLSNRISTTGRFEFRRIDKIKNFNQRSVYHSRLVDLLICELLDIKKEWTVYMQLIMCESIIEITFISCMAINDKGLWDILLLVVILVQSIVPLTLCILAGALIEYGMRQLYKVIDRLLVNERKLLKSDTLLIMLQISERLSAVKNRSLLTLGDFSLTTSSIGPIAATVASGIALLNRFIPHTIFPEPMKQ